MSQPPDSEPIDKSVPIGMIVHLPYSVYERLVELAMLRDTTPDDLVRHWVELHLYMVGVKVNLDDAITALLRLKRESKG